MIVIEIGHGDDVDHRVEDVVLVRLRGGLVRRRRRPRRRAPLRHPEGAVILYLHILC